LLARIVLVSSSASLSGGPSPCLLRGWGQNTLRSESHRRRFAALWPTTIQHPITEFSGHLLDRAFVEAGHGAMHEDAANKAERYRKEANKYGELAKQVEPGYLADVYRKVAVQYAFMAEDALKETERRRRAGFDWTE
jgi:hypothetical protein